MRTFEHLPARSRLRIGAAAAAVVLFAIASVPYAEAGDDPAAAVLASIKKARKGDADGSLADTLAKAVELHNASEVPADRQKLQAALGALLKAKEAGSGRGAAAEALGQLNDARGAWKQLKGGLPVAKREEVAPFELRTLEAVGQLAVPQAIADLAKLTKKGKARPAVTGAMRALGCYGQAEPGRVDALGALLDAAVHWKGQADAAQKKLAKRKPPKEPKDPAKPPKEPKPKKGDLKARDALAAWEAYAPVLTESLNKLTGRNLPNADEWLTLARDKKSKPQDLFAAGS